MPLQKSFSEQNAVSKRPQWQRSKSHSAAQHQQQQSAPKPLLPVSASTKNKLQKFQFQPSVAAPDANSRKPHSITLERASQDGEPAINAQQNEDIENVVVSKDNNTSPPASSKISNAITPISRLAWQDLMGIPEDRKEQDDISPSDRIMWQVDSHNTVSSALSAMRPEKTRKRARSSSPTSSPAHLEPSTPAVNVRRLTEALKTPHADPALELWDRFSLSGAGGGATNPLLAELMAASSPRPLQDGTTRQSEGGIRRAISCTGPWPKRRRLERLPSDTPTHQANVGPAGDSKSSLVSHLLETVTSKLEGPELRNQPRHASKSPSPLKRKKGSSIEGGLSASPTKRRSPSDLRLETRNTVAQVPLEIVPGLSVGTVDRVSGERSSDYGDDDFDQDTLMELDASLVPIEMEDLGTSVLAEPLPDVGQTGSPQNVITSDEDFGDLDDDMFAAAAAADLTAEINSKNTSQMLSHGIPPKAPHDAGGLSPEGQEDIYGDDLWGDFDLEAAEVAATQSVTRTNSASLSHPSQKPRPKAIQRYLVTNVRECSYADDTGREFPEKILVIQAERTSPIKTVHLRGDWYETPVSVKAYVHIIGDFESASHCIIDNTRNILILHPDQLISSTVIADSFNCMRRAVLQDRVKAASDASPPMVYGTMLHEIFQEALTANQWSMAFLAGVIDRNINKHIEDLYVIKVSIADAKEHLQSKMSELGHWAGAFVSAQPRGNAFVQGRNGERVKMCVNKLLDVEEHVWSPMYGLKGNIDATVQVTMRETEGPRTLTVPFEVKTGKNVNSSHQAQTVLYNLLLSDRYDVEVAYGILYYMETSQTIRIPAIRHELRHMIMQRNRLACYIRERSVQLPPMKRSKNACGKCFAQAACFTYHKLADGGDGKTSGMGDKFEDVARHLTPVHREFFLKWEDLLTKEERESQKLRRELWTMVSTEREKLGRCFANVVIEEGSASEDRDRTKINRFHYNFVKETPRPGFSFLDSQLTVGEPIVISDEQGHFALALGYVTAVTKRRISVAVDRRLHNSRTRLPGFDEASNQVFAGIMEVAAEGTKHGQAEDKIKTDPIVFRLDKDEFSNGMSTVRNNLVQIMADSPVHCRQIRRLVVDLVPPQFKQVPTQYTIAGEDGLNVDQKRAIEKVMSARDYALVLGMPGTGKTTTIAHIIRALIAQGKSVLLTSYTHTAVDNILLKLKEDKIRILRLGAPAKVHPEVRDFATLAGEPMDSFEEIRSAWHDSPVVATTCLGINHAIFSERTFDYCIVDEASQITLPNCLGPIRMARTFVLVGDHNQLPPLVRNDEARLGGLDLSLFKLLSDAHPQSVVHLEHQYRMCEDIMLLSNTLIYAGRLKCGTEALRQRSLHVPYMDALRRHHHDTASFLSQSQLQRSPGQKPTAAPSFCLGPRPGACWLRDLLDPAARVRFVNTDLVPGSREEAKGNRIVNPCEARVVAQLVDALLGAGVLAGEIGVMTHYRSQLALLRNALRGGDGAAVEMHTADRFQGRDKEVVVLSLVRSNEAGKIGELLRDWRRINVAFTRAKTKLLVVGSRDTLCGRSGADGDAGGGEGGEGDGDGEMLARFVGLMEQRDWVYDLPPDALESHLFDEAGTTQVTVTAMGSPGRSTSGAAGAKKTSPAKGASAGSLSVAGKENQRREPKKTARIGERALLKGKPVLRDIFNEVVGGMY